MQNLVHAPPVRRYFIENFSKTANSQETINLVKSEGGLTASFRKFMINMYCATGSTLNPSPIFSEISKR
jgi:hypothetical protein